MRGDLLVIIDEEHTYEVSRGSISSWLHITKDTGARDLNLDEEAQLKKLYWQSDAARF